MTDEEAAIKLTEVDGRARSNTKRLDKLEEGHEAIARLATAVEVMAKEQSHQSADVKEIKTKVETLEQKPAKRWEALVATIIAALVAGLIGYLMGG